MLKELERVVNELKSDEVNQVQKLCKLVVQKDKCQGRNPKSVVSQSNENRGQAKAKEVKPKCDKPIAQSDEVFEVKKVNLQIPNIGSCETSLKVPVTELSLMMKNNKKSWKLNKLLRVSFM